MRAAGENCLEVHCVCTVYITPSAKHVDEMSPAAKYVHEIFAIKAC